MTVETLAPARAVAHLEPTTWAAVNRALVAKALGEFAHELLIEPRLVRTDGTAGEYALATDLPDVEYRFRARRFALDHWAVDPASIRKRVSGKDAEIDALRFVIELRGRLAIPEPLLPGYLHELASTLSAAAYKRFRGGPGADELASAEFQQVEAAMTEGHPSFVANAGRLGFDVRDYLRYAPEVARPFALRWLAARRARADFACVSDLSYAALVHDELGAARCRAFARALRERGHDLEDYLLLPVHPWQWQNRIAQLFASDLARGDLVDLGPGEDRHQAQQSIRTAYNLSHPHKRYVKTALSILNMGFTRGIPAAITGSAAAVNDWVGALVRGDAYLARCGFDVLREVAFVSYRHGVYERAIDRRADPYKEMLAALWRESPTRRVRPGRRLVTMAALLHVDRDGRALLPALIRASGVSIDAWLDRYLRCYLTPLLHCFYAHHLTFTPHGENVILELEGGVPEGALIKDIAEDVAVLNPEAELPANVRRLAMQVPEHVMTLVIFTDVFDCVFRFLAPILHQHAGYPESRFWRRVAACIREYQRDQPQLAAKFRRYDLFAPTFARNCLNRLQLRDHRMMVDLNAPHPVDSLQFAGTLPNPIAPFREVTDGSP